MRYFNDMRVVSVRLAYGELLISGAPSPDASLKRNATTTKLEPGIIGKLAHEVSRRERTMPPLLDTGRLGRNGQPGVPFESEYVQRHVNGVKVTDREEISTSFSSDGYVAEFSAHWPGEDGYGHGLSFRELSSRRPYGFFTDMTTGEVTEPGASLYHPELLADSSLWQKLYIPAPWRDREMLGQAVLNALKYSDNPYRKWMTSFFDPTKPKGRVKLHRAAMDGDVDAYPKTNRTGKSYDIADSHGKTPLIFAAANGHGDVIERLLLLGADVNLGDSDGRSPLHHAAANGHTQTLGTLMQAGAHVNQLDEIGRTPLNLAAKNGSIDCARALLDAGAIVGTHDWEFSSTPLHLAARGNHTDVARILIQNGADIDETNEEGRTPLHVSSAYGHQEVMTLLLDAGAKVNYLDDIGESPLSSAVFFQHLDCMRLLIDRGANVNLAGYRGYTPLHVAAYLNRENAVSMLVGVGSDFEAKDDEGLSPLDLALVQSQKDGMYRNSEAIERFLEAGSSVDPMRIPVQDRHAHWPQFTSPHMVESNGYYLISSAIPDALSAPNQEILNPRRSLLCDVIAKRMNSLLIRLLELGIGESVDSKWFALEDAVVGSNSEAIRTLVEYGADLNYPGNSRSDDNWYLRYDDTNFRPNIIDIAIGGGQPELVRLLLELGAAPPVCYEELDHFNQTRRPSEVIAHPIAGCSSNADKDAIVSVFTDFGIEIISPQSLVSFKKAHKNYDVNKPKS